MKVTHRCRCRRRSDLKLIYGKLKTFKKASGYVLLVTFYITFDEPSTVSSTWVGADDYPIKFGKFRHHETFNRPSSGLMVILNGNASDERNKWHDDGAYIFYSARQEVLDAWIDDSELRKWS